MVDFRELKKNHIDKLNLPSWLKMNCSWCGHHMETCDIMAIGIELTPKTFGNLSVSYMCPSCNSLIEMHYIKAFTDNLDLPEVLSRRDAPSNPITYNQVMHSEGHNLL